MKYLEARLIEEARTVGRINLENGNTPSRPSLSEAAQANMEAFLENILMVLPAVRIDSFLKHTRPKANVAEASEATDAAPMFELHTKKHGIYATATLEGGEFVVQAGSKARKAWEGKGSENTSYGQLYFELVKTGVLQEQGSHRVFSVNYAFKSPSAAGAVVNGRPTSGPLEWKVRGKEKTYKQWEADKLDREQAEGEI